MCAAMHFFNFLTPDSQDGRSIISFSQSSSIGTVVWIFISRFLLERMRIFLAVNGPHDVGVNVISRLKLDAKEHRFNYKCLFGNLDEFSSLESYFSHILIF